MRFTKMQGCGNDYIFVEEEELASCKIEKEELAGLAGRLSDRHFGIGGDGVILLQKGKLASYEMVMYNADGSRGEICGNGIRQLAKLLWDKGYVTERAFRIESGGRVYSVEILEQRDGLWVKVGMGQPKFGERILWKNRTLQQVSMGNPHAVVMLEQGESWPTQTEGPQIETAPCFPDRTNVEFVKIRSRTEIEMRVWERGSGETLACGSGACAAAAVCMQKGLTDRQITVKLLGGELMVCWEADRELFLTGPAVTVYEGNF